MYSILIKLSNSTADRWKYLTNADGTVYVENDLENVKTKIVELLQTNLLSSLKVVKNCIITDSILIEEVEAE